MHRLCTACREPWTADDDTLQAMAAQHLESSSSNTLEARAAQVERWRNHHGNERGEVTLWRHKGCSQCEQHGYRGAWAFTS